MRPLGFTLAALLIAVSGSVVRAQQPGGAAVPPAPPPGAVAAAAPTLDDHLNSWERTMANVKNFHVKISLTRTDNVFKKEKKYIGSVACMKPNLAVLRLDYTGDPTGKDYEAYICNGKSVYFYNGLEKSVTEFKLPNPGANPNAGTDNLMLDFLSGLKSKEAKDRFDLSLYKEDVNYVYLNIKPKLGRDKQDFQMLNMALFGPKTQFPYLPCQVFKQNPNGDTEMWVFSDHVVNHPEIQESKFQYIKVPGFRELQANPQPPARPGPPPLPGATGLPAGPGTVRP